MGPRSGGGGREGRGSEWTGYRCRRSDPRVGGEKGKEGERSQSETFHVHSRTVWGMSFGRPKTDVKSILGLRKRSEVPGHARPVTEGHPSGGRQKGASSVVGATEKCVGLTKRCAPGTCTTKETTLSRRGSRRRWSIRESQSRVEFTVESRCIGSVGGSMRIV